MGASLVNVLHCKDDDVDDDVDHADDGRPFPQSEEVAAAVVRQHRLRLQRRSAVGRRHLKKKKFSILKLNYLNYLTDPILTIKLLA